MPSSGSPCPLTQLCWAQAGSQARFPYRAEIVTKTGNRSALHGFNTLSRDPVSFQSADGFHPILKHTCVACFAPMFCSKLSPVHEIKTIQCSAGTAPTDTSQRSSKGFTSLSTNGLRNTNPAEQHSTNTNQTVIMESLG